MFSEAWYKKEQKTIKIYLMICYDISYFRIPLFFILYF